MGLFKKARRWMLNQIMAVLQPLIIRAIEEWIADPANEAAIVANIKTGINNAMNSTTTP